MTKINSENEDCEEKRVLKQYLEELKKTATVREKQIKLY